MENQGVQANTQPVGYSIVFSPDKPQGGIPKCVSEYKSKPVHSPGTLRRKLDDAEERRKDEEQARLARIQKRDKVVAGFDKLVRPYLDSLQQSDEGGAPSS